MKNIIFIILFILILVVGCAQQITEDNLTDEPKENQNIVETPVPEDAAEDTATETSENDLSETDLIEESPDKNAEGSADSTAPVTYNREGRITEIRFSNNLQKYEGYLMDQKSYAKYYFTNEKSYPISTRFKFVLSSKGDVLSMEEIPFRTSTQGYVDSPQAEVQNNIEDEDRRALIKQTYRLGIITDSSSLHGGISEGIVRDINKLIRINYQWPVQFDEGSQIYYLRDSKGKITDMIPRSEVD